MAHTTLLNSTPRYANDHHPVNNEHINAAPHYSVPSIFLDVLQSQQPAPSYSSHHIPMSIHQPPPSASTPLPPYHLQSAPVMIELISDSEEEEGSVVEVSGAALTHQVCYFFFF